MTQSKKDEIFDRWAPIINNMSATSSNWLDRYDMFHSNSQITNQVTQDTFSSSYFPSILPLARRVYSSLGPDMEMIKRIETKVKAENRDGKIDSIVDGSEFVEKKLEDDPEYKESLRALHTLSGSILPVQPLPMPKMDLMYIDFIYGTSSV